MVALQEWLGHELAIREAPNSTLITIALVIMLNALRSEKNTPPKNIHSSLFLEFGLGFQYCVIAGSHIPHPCIP